ncbi:glycosyltransferase [Ornithinibacillus gellani]|uniref:glycosyltransferase family 2 protein n=1 Tax=Ornithinibacillus gellani TaxID=2293253 RepID=UPI000F47DF33|nr:glycosyltransferase [Ornithinibacillus gellani]TQS74126.1 glycosyltransferase [Ornithinibacillus gellani]
MQQGTVSVVVPVYKVEAYLSRCVDSIRNQTYPSLQIILVNDGSPDRCGEICEDYRQQDPRIEVIHKENGGLSDARNYGMAAVKGEYTLFVDSDDWLAPDLIEALVQVSQKQAADVVQANFYYAYDHQLIPAYQTKEKETILGHDKVMGALVANELVKNFAWGKLYRTKLIRDIPFKVGVLFEDIFWQHQVMQKVHCYVMVHRPMIYYYQREDSIVASYSIRNLDMIQGLKERHQFLETYYPKLVPASYVQLLKAHFIHYQLLLRHHRKDPRGLCRKQLIAYIRSHDQELEEAVAADSTLHRQLRLFKWHPLFFLSYVAIQKGIRTVTNWTDRNQQERSHTT